MDIATLTDFRKNMKAYFDQVFKGGKPLFISRPKHEDVVIMSRAEYDSMQETFHLLRSPNNASRLMKAVAEDKANYGKHHKLED